MLIRSDTPVTALELRGRLPRVCDALRVKTVADLLAVRPEEIVRLPGVGVGTAAHLREIQQRLMRKLSPGTPTSSGAISASVTESGLTSQVAIYLRTPVAELPLRGRLARVCRVLRASTARDVLKICSEEALAISHIGKGTVEELQALQTHLRAEIARTRSRLKKETILPSSKAEPVARRTRQEKGIGGMPDQDKDKEQSRQPVPPPVPDAEAPVTLLLRPAQDHLSSRANNLVARLEIRTVGELASLVRAATAKQIRGMGTKTVSYLRDLLSDWIAGGGREPAAEASASGEPDFGPTFKGILREVIVSCASRATGSQRNLEVWCMRRGLLPNSAGPLTLEEVAAHFGLTRERVRQIEKKAERHMHSSEGLEVLSPVVRWVLTWLRECLGLCPCNHLSAILAHEFGWAVQPREHELAALFSIMGSDHWIRDGIVRHPDYCPALLKALRGRAPQLAERFPEGRHVSDFAHDLASAIGPDCLDPDRDCHSKLFSCGARDGHRRVLPKPYVEVLLAQLSPTLVEDDRVWPPHVAMLTRGRTKKDVIRAALRVLGRPAHSSEIADLVRRRNEHFRAIRERDVHACLTLYEEFVPVGRGIYDVALDGKTGQTPEKHVTTAQAIAKLLEEHGGPMSLQRIVEHLEPEGFRESNIYAALTTVRRFVEVGYRVYTLRNAGSDEGASNRGNGLVVVDRLHGKGGDVIVLGKRPVGDSSGAVQETSRGH